MSIIGKLKLAAWVPPLVALIIGGTLFFSHGVLEEIQEKGRVPQQVINGIHALNDFARSYMRYQEERPKEQFFMEHEALTRFVADLRFENIEQRQAFEQILDNLAAMRDTFHKLVLNYESPDTMTNPVLYAKAEERLSNQFLIRSSDAVSRALRLKALIDEEVSETQDSIFLFIGILLALTTFPLTVIIVRMMKAIAASYATLRRGTEIVAEGNLDHVIGLKARDELGEFSRAFDLMTRKLRDTTISKNELERRVRERTVELQQRADQLARMASELTLAEQRERRRLAELLHDHLQQLLAGAKFRLETLSRGNVKDMTHGFEQVMVLLDDAIAASRSLTVELSPPILHEGGLAAGLEWLARWMKDKHDLEVTLQTDPRCVEDRHDIREDVRILIFQAARELLFNVVKHADTRRATVAMAPGDHDTLHISVTDPGRGFDPKAAEPGLNRKGGFGLFSIRERLALMGGRLDVESAEGKGARFRITAPMHPEHPRPGDGETVAISASAVPAPLNRSIVVPQRAEEDGRIRVLLADDHPLLREGLASRLLEESDIDIVGEASDGEEALEKARRLHPDVVLMDFSMPIMNGIEATRHLRDELPEVKVIGLSMYEEPDRSAAMIAAGARAYLTKSGRSDILIQTIRQVYLAAQSSPASI